MPINHFSFPWYNAMLTDPIDFAGKAVTVSGKPGLGIELDVELLRAHLHPASPKT